MILGSDEPGCNPIGFLEELDAAETFFSSRQATADLKYERIADLSSLMDRLRTTFLFCDFTAEEVCEAREIPDEDSDIFHDVELAVLTGSNHGAYCAYKNAEERIKALSQEAHEASREAGGISLVRQWRKEAMGLMNWVSRQPVAAAA